MAVKGWDTASIGSAADAGGRLRESADVDAAIARVLAAERDARAAVADNAARAQDHVQQARTRAQQIAERAARRSATVHAAVERRIAEHLLAIEQQRRALDAQPTADAALTRAVEQLAVDLTTASIGAAR